MVALTRSRYVSVLVSPRDSNEVFASFADENKDRRFCDSSMVCKGAGGLWRANVNALCCPAVFQVGLSFGEAISDWELQEFPPKGSKRLELGGFAANQIHRMPWAVTSQATILSLPKLSKVHH